MRIKKLFVCVILTAIVFLSGCSQAKQYYEDINVGMSYEQVIEIIGREPDSCKNAPKGTGEKTTCLWEFSSRKECLIIEFNEGVSDNGSLCVLSVRIVKNENGVILF